MSEPGGVLLGRAELERAFTALGERLARRGVVADLFVVGGAAMALAYDATRGDPRRRRDVRAARRGGGGSACRRRRAWTAAMVAQRAGQRLCVRQGRPRQATRLRSSGPAHHGRL